MKFEYIPGATPLDPDEIAGLMPLHITTQGQLNEWEAANILKAEGWLFSTFNHGNFLTIDFVRLLHKKMFEDTWKWAGTFRNTGKNIGVDSSKITTELRNILEDAAYQIIKQTYSADEIAYRFHHRLVWVHPFANGNGRHARLMADLLLAQAGETRFTWGKQKLEAESLVRTQYINALREADKGDYRPLAVFVRS
ncbi:MAG: mobile mystery protein B [Gammaproteobacteria bacterium]|nr:MAG: mobile mystery protein B [Gammaproteobacteria bacterium]